MNLYLFFGWFTSFLEYASIFYLILILFFVVVKKARRYDNAISVTAIVIIGCSVFRLAAWGRNIVTSDRALHYLTLIFGIVVMSYIYRIIVKVKNTE